MLFRAPVSRRSPFSGRLDLRFVLNFVLQHPATADDDDDDDDVDDTFPISLRLRDLLCQIADTTCPGMHANVSTLHMMARSRTTCIDEDVIVSVLVPSAREIVAAISTEAADSVPSLPVDRPHPRIATMILRPIDSLSPTTTATSLPHRIQLFRATGRRTTTTSG